MRLLLRCVSFFERFFLPLVILGACCFCMYMAEETWSLVSVCFYVKSCRISSEGGVTDPSGSFLNSNSVCAESSVLLYGPSHFCVLFLD